MRACVVTAAAPGSDLSVFAGHELHVVTAAATLTFEHTYTWWGAPRASAMSAKLLWQHLSSLQELYPCAL